jgi:hypothetical protein
MRVIIAGSRSIKDRDVLNRAIQESGFKIDTVISGAADGVDKMGEWWAAWQTPQIPVSRYPADWDKYGKAAGMIRNRAMALQADAAILLWDGVSRGTKGMRDMMIKLGKPIFLVQIAGDHNANRQTSD